MQGTDYWAALGPSLNSGPQSQCSGAAVCGTAILALVPSLDGAQMAEAGVQGTEGSPVTV